MFIAPQNIFLYLNRAHNFAVKADDLGIEKKSFSYVLSEMASMLYGCIMQRNAFRVFIMETQSWEWHKKEEKRKMLFTMKLIVVRFLG